MKLIVLITAFSWFLVTHGFTILTQRVTSRWLAVNPNDEPIPQRSSESTTSVVNFNISNNIHHRFIDIVKDVASKNEYLRYSDCKIVGTTMDVKVAKNETSPTIDELNDFHSKLYSVLEADSLIGPHLEHIDITIGSIGIGDELITDKDFTSFKGFDVIVHTTEIYKRSTAHSGSLVRRTNDHVIVSKKGRLLSFPRHLIKKVSFQNSGHNPE